MSWVRKGLICLLGLFLSLVLWGFSGSSVYAGFVAVFLGFTISLGLVTTCGWLLRASVLVVRSLPPLSVVVGLFLLSVSPAGAQTAPIPQPLPAPAPLGSVPNALETIIEQAASNAGTNTMPNSAFESLFNTVLDNTVAEQAAAAGAEGLGGPVTFGAMALTPTPVGSDCLAASCDAQGHVLPGPPPEFVPDGVPSGPVQLPADANWVCTAPSGAGECAESAPPLVEQMCKNQNSSAGEGFQSNGTDVNRSGDVWECGGTTVNPVHNVPAGTPVSVDVICCYNVTFSNPVGETADGTVITMDDIINGGPYPDPNNAIPGSGEGSTTPVSPEQIFPSGSAPPAGDNLPNVILPTSVSNEPASPTLISNLANNLGQQAASASNGQLSMPQGGISPAQVSQILSQSGTQLTVGQLFQPITTTSGQTISVTSNGQGGTVASGTPGGNSVGNVVSGGTSTGNLSSQQEMAQAAPCGNAIAGEQPCVTVLDFPWQQWSDQESTEINDCANEAPSSQTETCVQKQIADMARTQVQTQTQTQDLTDPYVSPLVQTQPEQKLTSPTVERFNDPVTEPLPQTGGSPIPPITLPLDEWPSVMDQLPNLNAAIGNGQCPTVTFTSTILNTTFQIGAQCLVLNAMQPYMAYVLPPIYLCMAFLLIMVA